MYTVIRFTSSTQDPRVLERVGHKLNAVMPGVYSGPRHARDGFACELSDADCWQEHEAAIREFMHVGMSAIVSASQEGVDVCVDVAVEPEDLEEVNGVCIRLGPDVARALSAAGVSFEVSIYGGDDVSGDTGTDTGAD